MNQNYRGDYNNYNMNMNFPSLGQANPSTNYSNSFGQNQNYPKGNNMQGYPGNEPPGYSQNQMYKLGNAAFNKSSGPLNKTLSSRSQDFVPSGGHGSNFFAGGNQPNMQPPQGSFNYPPQSYQTKQMQQPINQQQYPPNMYAQNPNQYYAQPNPSGYQHPGYANMSGGNAFFPSNAPSSTSAQYASGMSADYNENDREFEKVVEHIANLKFPEKREEALAELSKKRESFPQLAVYLWHSVGTLAILLQEIIAIYPLLSPQTLTQPVSYKVCNVLGLLQCLALHPDTRGLFLNAHIPLFLYPFLNTPSKSKPFENLRVTSLGVIGALVKGDDSDAINFLMQTEIIPLCLRIMKRGQELSRTVATFIVQKILLDENGLNYICQTGERFFAVCTVLNHMVNDIVNAGKDDQVLLKHIIRCYIRLAKNLKANEALRKYLPVPLRDLEQKLITDEVIRKWHFQLLQSLGLLEAE